MKIWRRLAKRAPFSDKSIATMFSVANPGSTVIKRAKLRNSRPAPTSRTRARAISDTTRSCRIRKLLVVSEIALALVLLVGAGLLLRSFARLMTVDPGFATENIVAMDLSLNGARFANRRHIFIDQVLQKLRALP